ncbi:MAG: phosphoribosylglycinamide formyltransferase [Deltaproteobacteria bacterium]|jgi:phosphoribosylglycinamide formyltransferase-1|nr:phosphoribosylglycinamide formyltransferase [Deltaproteobacteria bacterium]
MKPLRVAFMGSGAGSNLRVMLEHARAGRLAITPVLVLSDKPQAGVLEQARRYGVREWSKTPLARRREDFEAEMLEAVSKAGAEAVILAGYMRILGPDFIRAFPERILNIHPALLPSFPGISGVRDALTHQTRLSGCTVHFVDEQPDHGPIVIQGAVPLGADDTAEDLTARIRALEHRLYPQAVQWLARGRLRLEGRKVVLLPREGPLPGAGADPPGLWLVSPGLEDF